MKEKVTKKRFTFTLNPEVVKKAKKLAIDKDTNLSALIEKLLSNAIAKENQK